MNDYCHVSAQIARHCDKSISKCASCGSEDTERELGGKGQYAWSITTCYECGYVDEDTNF